MMLMATAACQEDLRGGGNQSPGTKVVEPWGRRTPLCILANRG